MSNNIENKIAFALASVGSGALTFEEFHQWIESIISCEENLPTYVFDLYDTKTLSEAEYSFGTGTLYNLSAYLNLQSKESEALWGIAALRGGDLKDWEVPITEKTALKRMEQYPHVVERFRQLFPFVEF